MGIQFDAQHKTFHLQARNTSYVFRVTEKGHLEHLYWGRKISSASLGYLREVKQNSFTSAAMQRTYDTGSINAEYPFFGNGDHRAPAYEVVRRDGSTVTELTYVGHRIQKGKPRLEGLPATYAEGDDEAQTLEIDLVDSVLGLKVALQYTAYENLDAITRSARLQNDGQDNLTLLRALSANVDFPRADFDMLNLAGTWIRERFIERRPLQSGEQGVYSRSGMSGHRHNPFIALLSKDATEDQGEVFGFNLVYSGNFLAQADVETLHNGTRVSIGIHPFDFSWLLEPGEAFQTPEAVLVYSSEGLGSMSRTYHQLYRTRLCRGVYRDKPRPVLVNNWEATYFNFNADKLVEIAKAGAEIGVDLFVLDDGWFGKRDSDNSSLGDWFPDTRKLPNGLADVVRRVNEEGLKFGLWFEPEMVSPDSDLYRAHPDWCLHVADRARSERRNQLTLDLSRDDVCDYIIKVVSDVLASAPIAYVKWDMNRPMTEIGSELLPPERQRETAHRYMLGLYRVLETITTSFPNVLFESCASGGGRFDPAMLHYMPQTWTSDNTDAVSRLKIQYGTSIVYPTSSMGSHVSAVPNHQMGRITPLEFRGHVSMSGNFGYELDLSKFTQEEKEIAKRQVAESKEVSELVQFGDFYRLLSPFEGNETAWMFVSADQSEAYVAYFRVFPDPLQPTRVLKLKGLDSARVYALVGIEETYPGDVLMNVGLKVPEMRGEYQSAVVRLRS